MIVGEAAADAPRAAHVKKPRRVVLAIVPSLPKMVAAGGENIARPLAWRNSSQGTSLRVTGLIRSSLQRIAFDRGFEHNDRRLAEDDERMSSSALVILRRRRVSVAFYLLAVVFLDVTGSVERGENLRHSRQAQHHTDLSWETHIGSRSERYAHFRPSRTTRDDQCETCHAIRDEWLVRLYRESTHGRRRLACASCHGGDSSTSDERRAHASKFVGRPTTTETLAMCRPCHTNIVEVFTTSLHYVQRQGVARLDCVHCHGAHAIGAAQPNTSLAYTCAGCHGLEYLPPLSPEFQVLLQKRDELTPLLARANSSFPPLREDIQERRRHIRTGIAALVHATDTVNAPKRIPDLVQRIEELKRLLEKGREPDQE